MSASYFLNLNAAKAAGGSKCERNTILHSLILSAARAADGSIMKKAGIVGGLGPASTLDYYRDIIAGYMEQANTDQYPALVIDSINMTEMLGYLAKEDLDYLAAMLLDSIHNLAQAGADFAVIASNTPHIVFDAVKEKSELPLVSIIEATCIYAKKMNYKKVLVLGTMFTMSNGLYTLALEKYGMEGIVPDTEGKNMVHNIIFPKLENGIVVPEDKEKMLQLIDRMVIEYKADAVILGCTELPLMIHQEDIATPVLNTAAIHVEAVIGELLAE